MCQTWQLASLTALNVFHRHGSGYAFLIRKGAKGFYAGHIKSTGQTLARRICARCHGFWRTAGFIIRQIKNGRCKNFRRVQTT